MGDSFMLYSTLPTCINIKRLEALWGGGAIRWNKPMSLNGCGRMTETLTLGSLTRAANNLFYCTEPLHVWIHL